jgi:hypothetical protein
MTARELKQERSSSVQLDDSEARAGHIVDLIDAQRLDLRCCRDRAAPQQLSPLHQKQ